jgi:TRAP-type C4-dicarboxylate transport system substrate-binding protein/DNA-binding MarR family transcriptional regulator
MKPADFRGFAVDIAARELARSWNRRLRPFGLTYVAYFILLLLADGTGRRPTELAAALRIDGSSLTGHLDRLDESGLIERRPDEEDRRATRVVASPAGLALLEKIRPVGEALRDLDPELALRGADPASQAERALVEVQEAVRQVNAAFVRVDRAASASVDALDALAQRAGPARRGSQAVLRVATMTGARAGGGATLARFANLVAERSEGAVRVELEVPFREPGGELRLLIDLRAGRLALAGVTAAVTGTLVAEAQALELPYLFDSTAHTRRVLDGPLGRGILAGVVEQGLLGLGIAANGVRSLTTGETPVRRPEDVRGLRLRTQQAPVNVYFAESLGAIAVPLPYERLAGALRDGEIDAQENVLSNIVDLRMWESQRYLTLTEHAHSSIVLIGNPEAFAALGPQRELVETALADAIAGIAAASEAIDRDALDALRGNMEIITLDARARAAFAHEARLVHERMARALGTDALARALRAVDDARIPAELVVR